MIQTLKISTEVGRTNKIAFVSSSLRLASEVPPLKDTDLWWTHWGNSWTRSSGRLYLLTWIFGVKTWQRKNLTGLNQHVHLQGIIWMYRLLLIIVDYWN